MRYPCQTEVKPGTLKCMTACLDCRFSSATTRLAGEQRAHASPGSALSPVHVPLPCGHSTVLGIIGRDGCMAQYVALPASNLHVVPPSLTDAEAVFAEPLAAACR